MIPALARVATGNAAGARGVMEARGHRRNGERFAGSLWFSTYRTAGGPRTAAILTDITEDLREQQEQQMRQALVSGRLLIGAFAHEIRNLAAALKISHAKLGRREDIAADPDYHAIAALLDSLSHLASAELHQSASHAPPHAALADVLADLRMIAGPSLADAGVETGWPDTRMLPGALAEPGPLLRVFLNLIENSVRAMESSAHKQLSISAEVRCDKVLLAFSDSGAGVEDPSRLFRPFESGAGATGLGLYVSRAVVRGFGGDLRYEPPETGSRFVVELQAATGDYGITNAYSSSSTVG
jgi:C4-dicarboxylate-specific signal transduction histidine kinase